jgi:hypothetical protein
VRIAQPAPASASTHAVPEGSRWRALLADRGVWVVAGLLVAFWAISAWWLTADGRVTDFDTGKHLLTVFAYHDAIGDGRLLAPLTEFHSYPPLVHLVGALGSAIGGVDTDPPIMAQNVVFLPGLAFGCFATARLAYGPGAAVPAAVFALGAPLVVAQFHQFVLDGPLAATIAVSVALLLASRRFARTGFSAAAGLAVGLALLTKQTAPAFLVGILAVLLLRGGWRNWPGLLAFAAVAAVVGGPWYVEHLGNLLDQVRVGGPSGGTATPLVPLGFLRLEERNRDLYYSWGLVNFQLFLPFALLFLGGTAWSATRWLRRRRPDDYTPELIAGGLGGLCLMTVTHYLDPRYTLPCLVFEAALATGWLAFVRRPWRLAGTGAVAAVALLNVISLSFGPGAPWELRLGTPNPGSPVKARSLVVAGTLTDPQGPPDRNDDVRRLLERAKRDGFRRVEFEPASMTVGFFSGDGLNALTRIVGIPRFPQYEPQKMNDHDLFLIRRPPIPTDPPPCSTFSDGSHFYVAIGYPLKPFEDYRFYCPLRR